MPSHTQTHAYTHIFKCTHNMRTHRPHFYWSALLALLYPQTLPSVQFFLPSPLASSLVAVVKGAERLSRAGIAFLIPAEPAFRFAAGLLPNRHHRSRPANHRGTQALMRAEAKSRCGRMDEGFWEGAKQGRQWW